MGAAPVGPAVIQSFKEKAPGVVFREAWGMTETGPLVLFTPLTDEVNGSCGILLPSAEAKVVDVHTRRDLGPYQKGELLVRGPMIMKGYLDNPGATAETVDNDGWLHSGDIATYDKAGRFFIVDRLKELIKVKGFQVAPAELEDLLRGHYHIKDVAVIGVPHDRLGEAPRAYIVLEDGYEFDEEHILEWVKGNAAPYKQLAGGIEVIKEIPKNPSGKILRKELLAMFLATTTVGRSFP